MPIIFSFLCILFLTVSGPQFLMAKTLSQAGPKHQEATSTEKELASATNDLTENIKDLRKNITNWRKIQSDGQLTAIEKKSWREKAENYLHDCEAYNDSLISINAKKLPQSEVSSHFLAERQTFQRELNYLRETLHKP